MDKKNAADPQHVGPTFKCVASLATPQVSDVTAGVFHQLSQANTLFVISS